MKRVITFLLPILILLNGCTTPPTKDQLSQLDYGQPPINYEATIKKYFDDVLYDPYSAHYDFEPPKQLWVKDTALLGGNIYAGYFIRVSVNAKNRLGGYTGKKKFGFIIKDENIIKVMNDYQLYEKQLD